MLTMPVQFYSCSNLYWWLDPNCDQNNLISSTLAIDMLVWCCWHCSYGNVFFFTTSCMGSTRVPSSETSYSLAETPSETLLQSKIRLCDKSACGEAILTVIKLHSCNKVINSFMYAAFFCDMMIMRQYCKLLSQFDYDTVRRYTPQHYSSLPWTYWRLASS